MEGWIKVEDKMPWCNSQVIALSVAHRAPRAWIAIYNEDGEWWAQITVKQEKIDGVTHWMPLPEAPSGNWQDQRQELEPGQYLHRTAVTVEGGVATIHP